MTKAPKHSPREAARPERSPRISAGRGVEHKDVTAGLEAGNLAVQRLLASGAIQPKMRVGSPGDPLEAEADRAADQVVQRKECSCGGSCPSCRAEEERLLFKRRDVSLMPPGLHGLRDASNLTVQSLFKGGLSGGDGAPGRLSAARPSIQRAAAEPAKPAADAAKNDKNAPTPGLIVDDTAKDLVPGQMKRSDFLGQLESATCAAAGEALSGTLWSVAGCPYIKRWFGYYRGRSAKHIEQAARRFADAAGVKTAADYIPKIAARVQQGVKRWVESGGGIPSGVPEVPQSGGDQDQPIPGLQPKAAEGGVRGGADAHSVRAQLGRGLPLGGGIGSKMGNAFGHDFSGVRVHTGATASRLSSSLNARAFTIGSDIAFNAGEYRPGTPVGDALLAHELAHVVQQSGGNKSIAPFKPGGQHYDKLEDSADRSAVSAVMSLWGSARNGVAGLGRRAIPSLRTGLRLQACRRTVKQCPKGLRWAVVGEPTATGPVCVCVWRCLPPGVGYSLSSGTGGYSGPSITCTNKDMFGRCPGDPDYETVDEGYEKRSEGTVIGVGAHMSPLGEEAACGCLPLDLEGDETGAKQVSAPLLPVGLDVTNLAGMGGGLKRNKKTGLPESGKKRGGAKVPLAPEKAAEVAPRAPKPAKLPGKTAAKPVSKPRIKVDSSGKMTHAENGRELVREGGLVRYKTSKKGTGKGGVCFSCNPEYYEFKNGRWQRKPGVKLPSETKPSKDVSFEAIKDRKPVKVDPKVPATKLGLDSASLGKFGAYLKDKGAVERVKSKKTVDAIKGQLAEEVVNSLGAKEAAGLKPAKKGSPTFFRGDEVSGPAPKRESAGAEHAALTDGIIAETYTEGGKTKLYIHRIYETKAGSGAAKGLASQVEWNYERIKEVGMSVRMTMPDGTVGWVKFAPEDITMPPRTSQASVVHGFVPKGVSPTESKDVTKAYTPRELPGITEGELHEAALMIHRSNTTSEATE